jgi:hypothetical protein
MVRAPAKGKATVAYVDVNVNVKIRKETMPYGIEGGEVETASEKLDGVIRKF